MGADMTGVLAEQVEYYRQRAGEYEDWWFRRGRYDHGPQAAARWFAEAAEVREALASRIPSGPVLELACGTGLWTGLLAEGADSVTAMDASPEVLALARERVPAGNVAWVRQDLFAWEPRERYAMCFFGFWLSHVPEARFGRFWETVWRALRPGGKVFFVDSARHELASAADHELPQPQEQAMVRRLNDGREFQIVKRFYDPETLERRLQAMGWNAHVGATAEFFIYGQAIKDPDEAAPRS